MYKNLNAEQARHDLSNTAVADMLGISRVSYENKKKNGKFNAIEAKKLCSFFSCSFEYLFATDDDPTPAITE